MAEHNLEERQDGGFEPEEGELEVIYVQGPPTARQGEWAYAERPNKSAGKRQMQALQQLAERLVGLSAERLQPLAMSEQLREALAEGRRLKVPDARRRHLRYLARLLHDEDSAPLQAFIDQLEAQGTASNRRFHALEQWRQRLIEEGDEALAELLEEYPDADRQQLRQLIRAAQREREQARPPAAARKLFQLLRAMDQAL